MDPAANRPGAHAEMEQNSLRRRVEDLERRVEALEKALQKIPPAALAPYPYTKSGWL